MDKPLKCTSTLVKLLKLTIIHHYVGAANIYIFFLDGGWISKIKEYPSSECETRLWIEETNELVVFETEISWNLKGLVAIAIATAVRKKSLAAAEPAIRFSETPPRRERALDRCSRIETPPLPALCSVPEFIEKINWIDCLNCFFLTYFNSLVDGWIWKYTKLWYG